MFLSLLILRLSKFWLHLRSWYLLRNLIVHQVFAAVEHSVVLEGNFATIIDVGANRGQFSLAARNFVPDATIVAFEPLPAAAETYRSVFAADPQVSLYEVALAANVASETMHVSMNDDSSSLRSPSDIQQNLFPGSQEVGSFAVTTARLSRYLSELRVNSPALLKIDVQGSELEVLAGAGQQLALFDVIYCECSFEELYRGQALASSVIQYLDDFGFLLAGVYNPCYDSRGRCVQADLLFRRSVGALQIGRELH